MLSEEVVDKVIDRLVDRIELGNEYILRRMGESIKQIGTLSPSKVQELSQVIKYGGDYEKIAKKLAKITGLNVTDIYKIFDEVAKDDFMFAKQFYKYRNINYIPYNENTVLKEQVRAIATITAQEYVNLANTNVIGYAIKDNLGNLVFKDIRQTYYELVDEAILNISQGKETFDDVMYRKMKEIGESGLRVIYPTTYIDKYGKEQHYTRRLDSAIRMNIKDGLKQLHNETQKQFGEEFNSDGVEISVHLNPAPDHENVQGHQFSNEEFEKFQNDEDCYSYDGTFYPAISDETGHDRRSIGEYNCYHTVFSIVLGVSKPNYTKEQLQQIIDDNNKGFEFEGKKYTNYQGTQLQRRIETEIRKAKDNQILGKASGNDKLVLESQQRITQLTKKYRELNNASGLSSEIDRARVSNYQRISTKKLTPNKIGNNLYDITDEFTSKIDYNKKATILDAKSIKINNKNYQVNNQNKIRHDFNEKPVAEWIKDKLHLDVEYLPNIGEDKNIKLGDYLVDKNEIWELKTIRGNSSRTLDSALKSSKGQASTFIVDITYSDMSLKTATEQVKDVFRRREWINKVIFKDKNKLLKVIEKRN